MRKRGFTIIELAVVVSVIALLAALLIGAVQYAREASRQTQCASNLKQIGIALQSYHEAFQRFPLGNTRGFSFHTAILPQLEQAPLNLAIDRSLPPWAPANDLARATVVPTFHCPSDPAPGGENVKNVGTNYGANYGTGYQTYGYNGGFRPNTNTEHAGVSAAEIADGLSRTAAVAEILIGDGTDRRGSAVLVTPKMLAPGQLGAFAAACESLTPATSVGALDTWTRGRAWVEGDVSAAGYNHVLPPNSNNCTNGTRVQQGAYSAASMHPGGVDLLYADGHIEFVSSAVDRLVWHAIGSRNGGD